MTNFSPANGRPSPVQTAGRSIPAAPRRAGQTGPLCAALRPFPLRAVFRLPRRRLPLAGARALFSGVATRFPDDAPARPRRKDEKTGRPDGGPDGRQGPYACSAAAAAATAPPRGSS